jgi:hypothetical protein
MSERRIVVAIIKDRVRPGGALPFLGRSVTRLTRKPPLAPAGLQPQRKPRENASTGLSGARLWGQMPRLGQCAPSPGVP